MAAAQSMDFLGKSLPTPVMSFTAKFLFWPTLLWNELLVRRSAGKLRWFDEVFEDGKAKLFLGGFPWRPEILRNMEAAGVQSVVSLVGEYEATLPVNFRSYRIPMVDFAQPDLKLVRQAVELVKSEISEGRSVYLHCKAGKGRSATVAVCFLIEVSAPDPVEVIRRKRPQVLRSIGQRDVVKNYQIR